MKRFVVFICVCALIIGCQTTKEPINRGVINPENIVDSELSILDIDKFLIIQRIDNKVTGWIRQDNSWRNQIVRITPGVHVFSVQYSSNKGSTILPQIVIGNFEPGKEYSIIGTIVGDIVKINIFDKIDNKNVTLNLDDLKGSDSNALSSYIKYVLNPTMEENNKTVKLENEDSVIMFYPNMTYSIENKTSGEKNEGYRGFVMDFSMTNGKVYLLKTDITDMTKDEFLNKSNYVELAQTILVPVRCTDSSLTYKYIKPDNLKDQEVVYTIVIQ